MSLTEQVYAQACLLAGVLESREQALLRIRAQKSESYFRSMCDHVLENTGTQAQFHEKCLAFFRRITIMEENTTNKEIKL